MAKILLKAPFAKRDEAHCFQAEVIASGRAPGATCTEDAHEVVVWDSQPTEDDVMHDRATRGKA
jgi:hypothetical protein